MFHRFDQTGIGTPLAAMLADAIVFFDGGDELPPFERIVRARFFDVDIFAGLQRPDADQRMPMIRRGNRDGVDLFVFEKFANVGVRLRFRTTEFFDVGEALIENVFIDVAERGDFDVAHFIEAVNVIDTAAARAADGDAHAIVRAEDGVRLESERGGADGEGGGRGFDEVSAFDGHDGASL